MSGTSLHEACYAKCAEVIHHYLCLSVRPQNYEIQKFTKNISEKLTRLS